MDPLIIMSLLSQAMVHSIALAEKLRKTLSQSSLLRYYSSV